ncbi:MAG: efflux RND transporter permease subunit [Armatimonadetes bacterium]|nr:efflux RND transporter permease subunit [Armatimonadota bacterium]HPO74211.1 efflux RND transporter permease subunit [Armatimonadota bacterium]
MINRLITFALEQRVLVLILAALLIGVGVKSALELPIDAVPDVTNVQVQINTDAPGLSPFEVEKLITFPLELAMSGLPEMAELRSLSKFGLSQITVVFKDHVDIYFARQLVSERLQDASQHLPPGVGAHPEMAPVSTGLGEIYQFVVERIPGANGVGAHSSMSAIHRAEGIHRAEDEEHHRYLAPCGCPCPVCTRRDAGLVQSSPWLTPFDPDAMYLRTLTDWVIKPQLRTVPGVAEVNPFGGFEKQYQVLVDPDRLVSYGLTLRDVFEALGRNNRNAGGAYIEHGAEQYLVRGVGLVRNIEEIKNIVITAHDGIPIRVRDVAEVVVGPEVRQGSATKDGQGEVVTAVVMLLRGANSRTVVADVKKKVEALNKSLAPAGVRIVPFYDRTELVKKTIRTVEKNLFEGAVLVVAVLFALLGNIRAALIVASAIPLSMLFALTGMQKYGISGNLMSLGAIDFGLIVDGSVIMVENCVRRLTERRRELKRALTPDERLATVRAAALEVRQATQFGEMIIIASYLPILTLTGYEGKMFKPMALTVVFALTGAMILSLTLIPVLCALFLRDRPVERENRVLGWVRRRYVPALRWAITHRRTTVLEATALFLAGVLLFPFLGSEFVPKLDEGAIAFSAFKLPSVSLSEATRLATTIEKVLMEKFPDEVETAVTKTGRAEIATDAAGPDHGDHFIILKPRSQWKRAKTKEELVNLMNAELSKVPGISYLFSQPIELRVNELISGVRSDVAVKVFGEEIDILREKAEEIAAVLREVSGAADTKVEQVTGLPMLQIEVDRDAISRYGINVDDVQEVVETAIGGKEATEVIEGDRRFSLVVRFPKAVREDPEAIKNTLVTAPNGQRIPVAELASVKLVEGPAQVSREWGQRRVVVETNVRGRDIGSFVAEAQRKIDERVKLPAGYRVDWGGQFENMQRARARLMVVVPVTLFLIFVLLFTTFHSLRQALLVFTGVPLAVTGGVFALFARGMPFSVSAGVGFIALFGVAVLNGLVMVSYINQLRQDGKEMADAIIEGAEVRLRPVLMTALVASLGFIPMALATGTGAEVQKPLATVVIGGLVTSTLLTLFVLPTLYAWFEGKIVPAVPKGNARHREVDPTPHAGSLR